MQIANEDGLLSIDQILEIDCKIIDNCEGVIVYVPEGDELQGGRLVEYNHAVSTGKPVCVFSEVEQIITYLTSYMLRG